jgi:hypothetical protein
LEAQGERREGCRLTGLRLQRLHVVRWPDGDEVGRVPLRALLLLMMMMVLVHVELLGLTLGGERRPRLEPRRRRL